MLFPAQQTSFWIADLAQAAAPEGMGCVNSGIWETLSYWLLNGTYLHRELLTDFISDPLSLMRGLGILPQKEVQDNSPLWTVWSFSCLNTFPLHCLILATQAFSWMLYFLLTWSNVVWDTEYSSICKFSLLEIINWKILAREEEQIWYCSML